MAKSTAVVQPNMGIYYDRPSIALDQRMLSDGFGFRIKEGKLSNLNVGWVRFEAGITLNGAVLLITDFLKRDGTDTLVFGTKTDLYKYRPGTHDVRFITPAYVTGTVTVAATAVTGAGTLWNTGSPPNAKAGDQIAFTTNAETDPAATWFTILTVNTDTSITLTASAGVVGAGHAYTIRKIRTGDENDVWIDDTFVNAGPANEDQLWMTNGGIQPPVLWNGTTTFAVQQDALGFTCKTLKVYSNMMIFGNLIQGGTAKPTDIINSNVGEPANVSSGLSEQFKVHGNPDEIMQMVPLGENLAIYSRLTVTVTQFIGDPLIFQFRNVINGVGSIARRSVADFGNYHEFLGRGTQYRFDGATVVEANKQVWRNILRQQDPTRRNRIFSHFDEEQGDLFWSIPLTTDAGSGTKTNPPARAVIEEYLEEVPAQTPIPSAIRAFPFTASGYYTKNLGTTWDTLTNAWSSYNFRWNDSFFFSAFPISLVGDQAGKLYQVNAAQDGDGAALPSFVRFGRRATGSGRERNMVSRVYPYVTHLTNAMNVTVRLTDDALANPTIIDVQSFNQLVPQEGHFTVHYRRGRYMEVEFGTAGPAQPWELSGYDFDIKPGGSR